MSYRNQAFSFIELAVLMVVVGLVVGGFMVSQDLARNARLQSVINDQDKYKKAIELFKEKYNYFPGDMPNATSFWGADSNCPDASPSTVKQAATCNCAPCDGRIDTAYKVERAWQQLSDAGLIENTYTGVRSNSNAYSWAAGVNMPASQVPGCGWIITNLYATSLTVNGSPIQLRQGIGLGLVAGGADVSYPPCLTPAESNSIDSKVDDGLPYSGNVIDGPFPYDVMNTTNPYTSSNETGVTSASGIISDHSPDGEWPCTTAASLYNTTASGIYCTPFFNTGL